MRTALHHSNVGVRVQWKNVQLSRGKTRNKSKMYMRIHLYVIIMGRVIYVGRITMVKRLLFVGWMFGLGLEHTIACAKQSRIKTIYINYSIHRHQHNRYIAHGSDLEPLV